ncbi:hypothetical protein GCM10008995_02710 [Halobellus salinus]|uniref:DUF1616 domain-containing protein n=1 Tax=Halobellus salinus TaxID=931585 RepID=A0A830EP49_9EURY|nr:DUF1616 domain-containing protein [Halobellus salinus]GGI96109.1 hypothetical protein GCM10008995_02710 [Halobellus salinus]SMP12937.1 Uncharacterized membrane protein [Halobellus salinus]
MAQGAGRDEGLEATVRQLPADLAFVLGIVALAVASIFVPVINQSPIRVLFALPVMLFIPGYVFIAALFPEAGSSTDGDDETTTAERSATASAEQSVSETAAAIAAERGGIDGIERVALSFGTSIAIVPLIGLVLNFTPWGIRLIPIVVSLTGFIVAATYVAARRRRAVPPDTRFRVPYRQWLYAARSELFEPDSRSDAALNVLMVCSILLATASVGYAVAVPKQGEAFTEFYLLTETDDGDLVADNYPDEFVAGENQTLTVGIGNHEHESVSYTVVVLAQDAVVENNSTTIRAEQQLRRFQPQVADNETWQRQHTVAPTLTGDNIRLTYLLYRGAPPADPSTDNAYREVHLWITVRQ